MILLLLFVWDLRRISSPIFGTAVTHVKVLLLHKHFRFCCISVVGMVLHDLLPVKIKFSLASTIFGFVSIVILFEYTDSAG